MVGGGFDVSLASERALLAKKEDVFVLQCGGGDGVFLSMTESAETQKQKPLVKINLMSVKRKNVPYVAPVGQELLRLCCHVPRVVCCYVICSQRKVSVHILAFLLLYDM